MQGTEDDQRAQAEAAVQKLAAAGDVEGAAAEAIRSFGPEIFRFLVSFLRSEQKAEHVFSVWSEKIWTNLPKFGWQSSFRTWAFRVAKNAALDDARKIQTHQKYARSLSAAGPASRIAEEVRSKTKPYLKTTMKDRFRELRQQLSDEDNLLLLLRVDRKMGWLAIAEVIAPDECTDKAAQKKVAARLRKRFQTIKDRLAKLSREAGLLPED